jgi:predicted ArsR family transcriptional regulator
MPAPDQRIIDALTTSGPLSVHQLAAKCRLGPQRLYPALQRLERGDAVVAAWVDQPRGRQRIYTLKQAEATQ